MQGIRAGQCDGVSACGGAGAAPSLNLLASTDSTDSPLPALGYE